MSSIHPAPPAGASASEHNANGEFRPIADLRERDKLRFMHPSQPICLTERRGWDHSKLLFVVGPGGAGKSTLGRSLAPMLDRVLIDLDEAFLGRIGDIGGFIRDEGYSAYKTANSELATALVEEANGPVVLITSSGFLATDNPPTVLSANRAQLAKGYSISLLPSSEINDAVAIIVSRQMTRSFNAGMAREEATARTRFETYKAAGDLLVCSIAPPDVIAGALMRHLQP